MSLAENPSLVALQQHSSENSVMKFYSGGVEAEKKPMIVLIGWFGTNNRYLSKYAQLYSKQNNCNVLTVIPPQLCFFIPLYAQFYVQKLLQLLENVCIEEQKNGKNLPRFIFHCQSNNGGMFLVNILKFWKQNPTKYVRVKSQFKGLVSEAFPGAQPDLKALWILAGYLYDWKQKQFVKEELSLSTKLFRALIYTLIRTHFWLVPIFRNKSLYLDAIKPVAQIIEKPPLVITSKYDWSVPGDQVVNYWTREYNSNQPLEKQATILQFTDEEVDHMKFLPLRPKEYATAIQHYLQKFT